METSPSNAGRALPPVDSAPRHQYDWVLGWVTKLCVVSAWLTLCAGSLVTGMKAALSDPSWPLFADENWYPKIWKGGLVFEDSHRLKAGVLMTITLTLMTLVTLRDKRRWMKWLSWSTMGVVLCQAFLGGLVIWSKRRIDVSMAHGSLAEAFFAIVVALAVFCSKGWHALRPTTPEELPDLSESPVDSKAAAILPRLSLWGVVAVYTQVVLGTGVRHNDHAPFWAYLTLHATLGISIVALVAFLFAAAYLLRPITRIAGQKSALTWPAGLALAIVVVQPLLGFVSYFANRARLIEGVPYTNQVLVSSTHLALGATLLGCVVVYFLRARLLFGAWARQVAAIGARGKVAAPARGLASGRPGASHAGAGALAPLSQHAYVASSESRLHSACPRQAEFD